MECHIGPISGCSDLHEGKIRVMPDVSQHVLEATVCQERRLAMRICEEDHLLGFSEPSTRWDIKCGAAGCGMFARECRPREKPSDTEVAAW